MNEKTLLDHLIGHNLMQLEMIDIKLENPKISKDTEQLLYYEMQLHVLMLCPLFEYIKKTSPRYIETIETYEKCLDKSNPNWRIMLRPNPFILGWLKND